MNLLKRIIKGPEFKNSVWKVARDLKILEIEPNTRRKIIESAYNIIGRIIFEPDLLSMAIEDAKLKRLYGKKAEKTIDFYINSPYAQQE